MRLGIPHSSLATPWSDSGRANTDSSQPPRSTELPTRSKPGWWEKGKVPLGLPCALREGCRCISKLGHSGQAGAAKDPLDSDVQRSVWELLPSMGKMDWELSSRTCCSGPGLV